MSDAILKTKWGNAKVDNHGYYQITSAKYGKKVRNGGLKLWSI